MNAIGQWSQDLFLEFRRARGVRRRLLLNRLIVINEPLVRTLVSQLCGRGGTPRAGQRVRSMGGCQGFRDLDADDAHQAGLMALVKALEQFDPAMGKISYYLKLKIRYELQSLVTHGGLRTIHVPRGREDEARDVALVGDQQEFDLLAAEDLSGVVEVEGVSLEDLLGWQESGVWPESLEAHLAKREAVRVAYSLPPHVVPALGTWERFLAHCSFVASGRVEVAALVYEYRRLVCTARERPVTRAALVRALCDRGVRTTRMRPAPGARPAYALAGLRWCP